jgi:hypothetical protein
VAELAMRAARPRQHSTAVNERNTDAGSERDDRAWICTHSSAKTPLRKRSSIRVVEQGGEGDPERQRKIARQAAAPPAVEDSVNCAECASGTIVSTGCANAE